MNTQDKKQTAIENNPAQITLLKIREWGACSDGRDWFREKFPQGGAYGDVMTGLYADKLYNGAWWLANKAFDVKNISADFIESDVRSIIAATEGVDVDSGYKARAAFSGNHAQAAFSGYGAQAAFSGYGARAAFSGNGAQAAFSGYKARAAFSGNHARAECTGEHATVVFAGLNGSVSLGKGGAATLTWNDGTRDRFVHLYEGEDGIETGVLYTIKDGKVVRV